MATMYRKVSASPAPADPSAKTLSMVVDRIVWEKGDGLWAIIAGTDNADGNPVKAKGNLAHVVPGEVLTLEGYWPQPHPTYGYTFMADNVEVAVPKTRREVLNYLPGVLHGVGPKLAEKIVDTFGDDTLDVIDTEPERLLEISGITEAKLPMMMSKWDEKRAVRQVYLYLSGLTDVTSSMADRIYQKYGEQTIAKLEENPYRLTEMHGVGFARADGVALSMGIALHDPRRVDAGLVFVLENAEKRGGHTYLPLEELLKQTQDALEVESFELIADRVFEQAQAGKIIVEPSMTGERHVYTPRAYKAETRLTTRIKSLIEAPACLPVDLSRVRRPTDGDFIPTDEQWSVMQMVLSNRLSILTGGPGTGKCIRGDMPVVVNGDVRPIQEVWWEQSTATDFDGEGEWSVPKDDLFVPALNDAGQMVQARVTRLYRQRVRETGRQVCLQDGSELVMTERHRVRGVDDWQRPAELAVGDKVCLPGHIPHQSGERLDPRAVALLAWQIAEGHEQRGARGSKEISKQDVVTISQSSTPVLEALQEIVRELAEDYGFEVGSCAISSPSDQTPYLRVNSLSYRRWQENYFGYNWGELSARKRIPGRVMRAADESVTCFLREIFAAEGSVEVVNAAFEFSSASRVLVQQVALLLRRFGILMRIRKTRKAATNGTGTKRTYWCGTVSGPSLRIMRDVVGIADAAKDNRLHHVCVPESNGNVETIPVADVLGEAKKITGLSRHFFGVTSGYFNTKCAGARTARTAVTHMRALADGSAAETYSAHVASLEGRGGHRYKAQNLAAFEALAVDEVRDLADQLEERIDRDVFYSKVIDVRPVELDGWVYDFEVEGLHNYVAGGMVTHNTASLKMVCDLLTRAGLRLGLAAPTGKAAKRIKEATGHRARTIHRVLEWRPQEGFTRTHRNPLEFDLLVIDETSMVSLFDFDSLLNAVGKRTHVLMVGDIDQLPPVGAGKVFQDIITSKCCPITRLTQIFRQAAKSMIIQAAYRINQGKLPMINRAEAAEKLGLPVEEVIQDFVWIPEEDNQEIMKTVLGVVGGRLPRKYGWNPVSDIQVIAPQRGKENNELKKIRGQIGVAALNQQLQRMLNADGQLTPISGIGSETKFRLGDKLLQTRNDYTSDIMNGEFVRLVDWDSTQQLATIEIDGRIVQLGGEDMKSFELAYATTVHKMQGSSAKAIVIPISTQFYSMLNRKMLYTAVTRAEQMCVIVGSRQAFSMACRGTDANSRWTDLSARLLDPALSGRLV